MSMRRAQPLIAGLTACILIALPVALYELLHPNTTTAVYTINEPAVRPTFIAAIETRASAETYPQHAEPYTAICVTIDERALLHRCLADSALEHGERLAYSAAFEIDAQSVPADPLSVRGQTVRAEHAPDGTLLGLHGGEAIFCYRLDALGTGAHTLQLTIETPPGINYLYGWSVHVR